MNRHRRRLDWLEKRLISKPILLKMPNGATEEVPGHPDYLLDLMIRSLEGESVPVMEIVAQSVGSEEPGGAHMVEVARLLSAAIKKQMQVLPDQPLT